MTTEAPAAAAEGTGPRPLAVTPWPTEQPLFVLVLLVSLGLWSAILLSIFGAIYAALIALALFLGHLLFIVHVRGSGVRLGPQQLPELDRRVRELALAAGLTEMPAAYIMQAGGALNAFATKFLRGRMIVLFSDLLDACGNDRAARDMIIGHEIGHLRQGHLDWHVLIAPGMFVPFLGGAYSRARELTCDRWGAALCGDRAGALRGLAILAAGAAHGPKVDLASFVAQRQDLDTGWMAIGRWLSTYPTLAERVAALDVELAGQSKPAGRGPVRGFGLLALGCVLPIAASVAVFAFMGARFKALADAAARITPPAASAAASDDPEDLPAVESIGDEAAARRAQADLAELAAALEAERQATGNYPEHLMVLAASWSEAHDGAEFPRDPFDGDVYGYLRLESGYRLWSSGPDRESETADDLTLEGPPTSR